MELLYLLALKPACGSDCEPWEQLQTRGGGSAPTPKAGSGSQGTMSVLLSRNVFSTQWFPELRGAGSKRLKVQPTGMDTFAVLCQQDLFLPGAIVNGCAASIHRQQPVGDAGMRGKFTHIQLRTVNPSS